MTKDREAPLQEHLTELAIRLRRILIAIGLSAAILSALPAGFNGPVYVPLISKLPALLVSITVPKQIKTLDGKVYNVTIMPSGAFESLSILFYAAILMGVIGASPVIAREIWGFIEPALYPHEKRFVKRYVPLFVISFIAGSMLGIFLAAPLIMRLTLSLYPYFVPQGYPVIIKVGIDEAVSFAIEMAIAMGLIAESPIIAYLLLAYGIIDPGMIGKDTMKYIFLGSMVLGAIISPDPSGIGMIVIGLSIYLPLHIAIKLGIKAYHRRKEEIELRETLELVVAEAKEASQPQG
ncbi:MAG: twin-arginine translocase subunit TatC [Pyrodictiaceae archaeon]